MPRYSARNLGAWIAACVLGVHFAPVSLGAAAAPPPLRLPTPNRALLEPGGEQRFFVGTAGHPWTHGLFGCTRTGGWQFHEGIDIRATLRDRRNEPTDPVYATADGRVAYVNRKAGLSNYGIYVVLVHRVSGVEVWSLYAHLADVQKHLAVGHKVAAGEPIATLGHTTNTREGISKDRAHLHFELGFLVHPRFPEWLQQNIAGARNDHGIFNGQNFIGIDPRILLLSSHRYPDNFDLARYLTVQTELFRVAVRTAPFEWLRRYPMLVQDPRNLAPESVAGYEIHVDYTGVPVRIFPRTDEELPSKQRYALLSVNEEEYGRNPCRRLVIRQGSSFQLGSSGKRLLDLLTF